MEEFFRTSRGRNIKLYHIRILRYPGAVNRVWLKRRRKFSRTGERCYSLRTTSATTHSKACLWLDTKNIFVPNRRPASVALLLCPSYNMLHYGISSVLWVPFSLKTRLELLHELDRNDKQSTLQVDSCKKRGPGFCTQATLRHPHFLRVWKLKVCPPPGICHPTKKKRLTPGELSLELGGGARVQLNWLMHLNLSKETSS